ncbi:MAG: sodium:proton antiporter [Oscillospiraceae bacterium]|nr:sodium:proton antiporter [Oscillospiraceae bacterium]
MRTFLVTALVLHALLVLTVAAAAVRGPRFTDRLVAINLLSTLTLSAICILTVYLGEDFLIDVALIYALVSFVAVAVLARLLTRGARLYPQEEEGEDAR